MHEWSYLPARPGPFIFGDCVPLLPLRVSPEEVALSLKRDESTDSLFSASLLGSEKFPDLKQPINPPAGSQGL